MYFNGIDNYINFDQIPLSQQSDDWTISAWINPSTLDQHAMAICLGFDDSNDGNGYEFGISGDNYASGNDLDGILGGVMWIYSGYTFPAPNTWYHIVMLRRDGVTRLYVDGAQTPTVDYDTPRLPTAFTIGSGSGVRFFHGAIDDVRIYKRALSDAEVFDLYLFECLHSDRH